MKPKLKQLGERDRKQIQLVVSSNRRMRAAYEEAEQRRKGPGACRYCSAESCGGLWTRPGQPEPGGERCCDRCTHEPAPGWQHTHTAWAGGQAFPVCALRMREGEVVYLRRDGLAQFIELVVLDVEGNKHPGVVFQGRQEKTAVPAALYLAGEGGLDGINLWEERQRIDEFWLALRTAEARERDEVRKVAVGLTLAQQSAEIDRLEAERLVAEAARRARDIEQKALEHETVTVLRELMEAEDRAEEALLASGAEKPSLDALLPEGARPGKPELSPQQKVRQKRARQKQLRAQAMVEARKRLEVKRLERKARFSGETLLEEGRHL